VTGIIRVERYHVTGRDARLSFRRDRRAGASALVDAMGGRVRRSNDRARANDATRADEEMGDADAARANACANANDATTAPRGEGAGKNRAIRSMDCRVASTRRALASSMRLTRARARARTHRRSVLDLPGRGHRGQRGARATTRDDARDSIAKIGFSHTNVTFWAKISFARDPAFLVACV